MTTQNQSQKFSFKWSGGFSYFTYLKKNTVATITNQKISVITENLLLGVIPMQKSTKEIDINDITSISTGLKINWFDLVSAGLFLILSLLTLSFWPLILTVLFLLLTFNTSINIVGLSGNRTYILTKDKQAAVSFAKKITRTINQTSESVENAAPLASASKVHLVPTVYNNKTKYTFQIIGACVVAIAIFIVAIFSRGGFENSYVQWVRDYNIPGINRSMSSVLENKEQFTDVEWQQVTKNGNEDDVNKYVMYKATYSESGVSVNLQTIFQVYAENQFDPVEFTIDGASYELPEWNLFLVDVAEKQDGNKNIEYPQDSEVTALDSLNEEPTTEQTDQPATQIESVSPVTGIHEISLMNFLIWDTSDNDKKLSLNLDGEKSSVVVGNDTPNGINLRVFIDSMQSAWRLDLPVVGDGPFDEFGDLFNGFSLYLKDHDFDEDGTPELVVAASNQIDQTFVWVFGYNFVALENGTAPLELLLNVEGQADIYVNSNSITLPYGSQGLFDEYIYDNGAFTQDKQN